MMEKMIISIIEDLRPTATTIVAFAVAIFAFMQYNVKIKTRITKEKEQKND